MTGKNGEAKVAFYTLGCKVNYADAEALVGLFRQEGFHVVDFQHKADIYVINTCTVTHVSDRKSRQVIRQAKRKNPEAMIVVTGCYAQVSPQEVSALEEVDLVWGTRNRHYLPGAIREKAAERVCVKPFLCSPHGDESQVAWDNLPWNPQQERTRAFLKIQEGCQEYCTYCVVPYARGPLRSLPPEKVLEAARQMVASGYKEIVLAGVHLGKYGSEFGDFSLVQLLERLLTLDNLFRVRLSSLEPMDITRELVSLMRENLKICRHLHIPLQSGDNDVLSKMKRPYNGSHFIMLMDFLKEQLPGIALTSDVMVGFPGEGELEFLNTKKVLEKAGLARLHVFKFSARKGTPAANFSGQVPSLLKEKRSKELILLGEKMEKQFRQSLRGKTEAVLFERKVGNYLEGLTEHYIKVRAYAPEGRRGEIWLTRLAEDKQDYYVGEIISFLKK